MGSVMKQVQPMLNEGGDLMKLKFYHGVQTKEDAQKIMKDSPTGDFLFRATFLRTEVRLVIYMCIKVGEKEHDVHHYLVEFKNDGLHLRQEVWEKDGGGKKHVDSPPFKDHEDMIQYYRFHRLACGIRLGRAINRPKYQLRHSEINYEESGKLGSGNFCVVYRGKLKRTHREEDVAIKVSKQTEHDDPAKLMETRNELFAEAKTMISYNHVNVIKLFGLACDKPPFMVCLEFCNGGSLESHLYKRGADMEEFERQTLLIDATRGMRYLHARKCVHRDLASRNCLISAEGFIKIADFGLSKTLGADQTKFKEALKEAPLVWLAPECLQKESEFSIKSDVWAFGVLMYEVYFNGKKPFEDEKDTGVVIKAIRKANMPLIEGKTKIQKMVDLHSAIWTRKPEDRVDFQRILERLSGALISTDVAELAKMQINKLDGVTRKKMPNTCVEREQEMSSAAESSYNNNAKKKGNTHHRKHSSAQKIKSVEEKVAKLQKTQTSTSHEK